MKRIWKYPLEIADRQFIEMPKGAKILTVQAQQCGPCLWALVDDVNDKEAREIKTYGTGHSLPVSPGVYISTYQLPNGLVFHIFEKEVTGEKD